MAEPVKAKLKRLTDDQQAVRAAAKALLAAEGTPSAPTLARAYFAAWVRLLKHYHPLPTGLTPHTGLPPDLAAMLTGMFGYLAAGIIPEFISDAAKGRGRRRIGPAERKDIEFAVAYVDAAKRGDINDASPIKTIQEHYGVARSTVWGWLHSIAPPSTRIMALKSIMENAGKRYRMAGRSHSAISKRG